MTYLYVIAYRWHSIFVSTLVYLCAHWTCSDWTASCSDRTKKKKRVRRNQTVPTSSDECRSEDDLTGRPDAGRPAPRPDGRQQPAAMAAKRPAFAKASSSFTKGSLVSRLDTLAESQSDEDAGEMIWKSLVQC